MTNVSTIVIYVLVLVCIFVVGNPMIQVHFANLCNKSQPDSLSGFFLSLLVAGLLVAVFMILKRKENVSEPFLFQVSKFNPRCNGLYIGKPTTFQYDRIGCNYNEPVSNFNPDFIASNGVPVSPTFCKENPDAPLGYIAHKGDDLYDSDPKLFPNFGDKYL
jgi:hypothetical protein